MGTRTSRLLRNQGDIPVVIYGHGETPESISVSLRDVKFALAHGARMLQVDIAGKAKQYLIKVVQYDHFGETPIHLDLTRVAMDERVKVKVGIELRGTPKGVEAGGFLDQHMADIEVECFPIDIPGTFHPLVLNLEIGDSLLVKDLEMPENVTALADEEERVASVREPIVEKEEDAEAEGEEGDKQPEVIGRVAKEDDGDEAKSS